MLLPKSKTKEQLFMRNSRQPRDDGIYCSYPPWERLCNEPCRLYHASSACAPAPTCYESGRPSLNDIGSEPATIKQSFRLWAGNKLVDANITEIDLANGRQMGEDELPHLLTIEWVAENLPPRLLLARAPPIRQQRRADAQHLGAGRGRVVGVGRAQRIDQWNLLLLGFLRGGFRVQGLAMEGGANGR